MTYKVEDLDDTERFRIIRRVPYNDLMTFVLEYLGKRSAVIMIFWSSCIFFLMIAVYIRININGLFPHSKIMLHSLLGFIVFPVLSIPVHESLHVIPYYLSGARDIRAGMDLRQFFFYVTAHRYVAKPREFKIVASFPYQVISLATIILIYFVPGLWKWSLAGFLFAHATMCAGDFALLNFYFMNRDKEIYTWDDADKKEAYFYEKLA
ncbi:MAG TPA: DUF3267 domain-containing protein [Bacteroidales bacterium]|nr:DUF3267 domain-containing protein [Bacteroidales bacterium]